MEYLSLMISTKYLEFNPEVRESIKTGGPVVALESTIIAHGMPYPQNVETDAALETIVRNNGAVPATIGILDGRIHVGMTASQIDFMGMEGPNIVKCSRRDLPVLLAKRMSGATTVAATMIIAGMSGIRLFATGGIGGVHRGAETTMDISADLPELARTSVAVVSAGVKSVLDIGLTLEYLETAGVPVIGYRTDEFPAFYTRKSGFAVRHRMDDPSDIAEMLHLKWAMALEGGVVIANPVSQESSMEHVYIQAAIEKALGEMEEMHIRGKDITPFLLKRIAEITGGRSLKSNIDLVRSNAALASAVAREYCRINAHSL